MLLGVAAAIVFAPHGSAQAHARTVRIMSLGDSITDGYNVPGGYRVDLEDDLVAEGINFDFVGTLANGPAGLAHKNHEGHNGFEIGQVSSRIDVWLAASEPDVVLLMIGTNDVLHGYGLATAPDRLAALLDEIQAARPHAKVFVASIPPLSGSARGQQVRSYNSAIPDLVRSRASLGHSIAYIEIGGGLTTADLVDGVHPSAAGYSKIAALWDAALIPALAGTETHRCRVLRTSMATARWGASRSPSCYAL